MTVPRRHRRPVRALAAALAALALAAALAACGVAAEPEAHRIEPGDVPFGLLDDEATTTVVEEGRTSEVYLVSTDRLVAVDRSIAGDAELADLLEQVIAGPTEVEQSLGITTAVPAGTLANVDSSRGVATVDLNASFGDIRSGEQIFALGQIVYTLTGQPGIGAVRFTVDGQEIAIPLADGTLTDGPLSRDDFTAIEPA